MPPAPSDGSNVESLVADCLQRLDDGDVDALTEICAAHPEHAEQLRERVRWVLDTFSPTATARRFGHYEVVRTIGSGGMGEVLLARQTEPVRRLVALKVLHASLAGPAMAARFQLEGQALATFDHPGIAQVFDAGTDDSGRPYYVMELIDGQPLTEFADAQRLTIRQRIELIARVADAVHHAHQRGVIHRDLKPSNVLVRMVDGTPAPKVIDFGLAKFLHQPMLEEAFRTQGGQVLGTPAYMSPEQASPGREVVDARSDIYSLGVILHELLVGSVPLGKGRIAKLTPLEFLDLLRASDVPHPSVHLTDSEPDELRRLAAARATTTRSLHRVIHGELSWVMLKALARDPRDRYDAMSAFAADLRRYLDDEPLQAGPPTTSYRLWKIVRRHRIAVAVGAVFLLGVAAATAAIVRLGWLAQANLQKFDRLADDREIEELIRLANDRLWPARPEAEPRITEWLRRVDRYLDPARLAAIQAELDALPPRPERSRRDGMLHDGLTALQAAIAELQRPETGVAARVRDRLEWASSLEAKSVGAHREVWQAAIERARERHGIEIAPEIGLVPLGPDPVSTLEEFAFLTPGGRIPERDADGRLRYDDPTVDPVLILVPGGDVTLGSHAADPTAPRFDAHRQAGELPVVTVRLEPYWISKFEITQAQWERVMGSNPSRYSAPAVPVLRVQTGLHPVERVSWTDCAAFCLRTGLRIPTEAFWEHAARGGRDHPWWTGPDEASTFAVVNLRDRTWSEVFGRSDGFEGGCTDTWPVHCPVGTLPANPYGLHEVLGNVWEFCYSRAPWPPWAWTADIAAEARAKGMPLRGGSFAGKAVRVRVTSVLVEKLDSGKEMFGFRPVMVRSH